MAENMIKFLRGNVANLPQTATAGALYFTKDEGIYMGMEDGSYHRYGEFIVVADVDSLPASGAHDTCMYYCVKENILAKYDSTKGSWTQINKQPDAETLKTILGLGTLAYKSEVAEGDLNADLKAKVNAAAEGNHSHDNKALLDTYTQTEANLADAVAKKHSHTNADELAKIADGDKAKWDAVVADHLTSADKTTLENSIKEAKQAGTDANTNVEAYKVTNDARVKAVEDDIAEITDGTNGILAQAKAYADGKDGAIAEAKAAGTTAQSNLEAYQTSNNAALAEVKATADAAAVKTEVESALSGKVDKVDGKDLIATSEIERLATLHNYDDTQVKADIAKKADAETMNTELGKKVDKVEGFSLVSDTEIARLANVDNYDDEEVRGLIGDNAQAIEDLEAYVGTIPETATATNIVAYVQEKTAGIATDTALEELTGRVAQAETDIDNIEKDYLKAADKTELSDAIAAEKDRAEGIEGGLRTDVDAIKGDYLKASDKQDLQTQIDTIMNNPDTEGVINSINEFTQYIEEHGEIAEGFRTDIDANAKAIEDHEALAAETYETKTDAGNKLTEAKNYADGLNTAMDTRVKVLEGIDHDAYVAADTTLKSELQAEIDADVKALADGAVATNATNIAANAEAIATKANATDVYAKTETFTKDEVAAAIEAAVTTAHTWGEF